MANIFKGAEFGNLFLTRDNRRAVFLHSNEYAEILIVEGDNHLSAYHLNGTLLYIQDPNYDIISKYDNQI